jgi:hypothetical protein
MFIAACAAKARAILRRQADIMRLSQQRTSEGAQIDERSVGPSPPASCSFFDLDCRLSILLQQIIAAPLLTDQFRKKRDGDVHQPLYSTI